MRLPHRSLGTLLLSALLMSANPASSAPPLATLDSGVVQGVPLPGGRVSLFAGIPYAAPPLGALRWQPPQPVHPWSGIRLADHFGSRAMQYPWYSDMIFRDQGQSEDCLYLNVWTPAKSPSEKLAVMVWIHGGGLQAGSASEPRQDGAVLATHGVVVVGINYRLGVLGFMAHPALSKEQGGSSGNYGFMDQIAALHWVKRNIAAFGGDPGNVTIFGESAGAESVSALMASPLAHGLFHRGIGQSGALLGSPRHEHDAKSLAATEDMGRKLAEALGAKTLEQLRALPAERLIAATGEHSAYIFGACIDGRVLPEGVDTVYAKGLQERVPLMVGCNADEQRVYATFGSARPSLRKVRSDFKAFFGPRLDEALAFYPIFSDDAAVRSAGDLANDRWMSYKVWKWAYTHGQPSQTPVYHYLFARKVPVAPGTVINGSPATSADVGAVHASDIPYTFGALDSMPGVTWTPQDHQLAEVMMRLWSQFAKTGNPNAPGLPDWPTYDAGHRYPILILDTVSRVEPDPSLEKYRFLDSL